MMRIGIITFHRANNYGAVLQAWALSKWLFNRRIKAEIIDYHTEFVYRYYRLFRTFRYKTKPYSFFTDCIRFTEEWKRKRHFSDFRRKALSVSREVFHSNAELKTIGDAYDYYICGSDQIWNPRITMGLDPAYFLDFVTRNEKKISYAPSIAVDSLTDNQIISIIDYISDFHAISVREKQAIEMLQPYCAKTIDQVCDPVFLLSTADYAEIERNISIKSPYIFLYIVGSADDNLAIIQEVEKTAKKVGIKLYYIIDGGTTFIKIHGKNVYGCRPGEFISYVKNARYVISNSFHATAFSIIYKTQFISFVKAGTGSRIINLLAEFGLENRICYNSNKLYDLISQEIDYSLVIGKVNKSRRESEQFLESAIKKEGCLLHQLNEKKSKTSDYQALKVRIADEQGHYLVGRHRDEEILKVSRSGGLFTAISDYILDKNGIVYGCKMEGYSRAIHARAATKEERDKFRESKYIQSEIGECYLNVKTDLEEQRIVLFTGTGCQIAGLRKYLIQTSTDMSGLYTIDNICHGVPSPKVWNAYLQWLENKYHSKIINVTFRDKRFGWASHFETVELRRRKKTAAIFRNMFSNHYILRPSCYKCPFSNMQRQGDITLGDAWGIENTTSQFNDNKGCSLIILNSDKGTDLFNKILDKIFTETVDINDYMQPNLKGPSYKPNNREEFWVDFLGEDFEAVMKKYGKGDRISHITDILTIHLGIIANTQFRRKK